jgi:RNA polymerase sigma-70 factor (ECF subfamily)
MDEKKFLAERFEENRPHMLAVAHRMLGSRSEAEEAVQEAWVRLSRADPAAIANLRGWLTTVVARLCLDILRGRKTRREEPLGPEAEAVAAPGDAERDALMAESVGVAMLVLLERLSPAERIAFVLHDMFNLPFDDIAPIIGRSTMATTQLASRARRRIQGSPSIEVTDYSRQRELVAAFHAASRNGDFAALLAVLDPAVVLHADEAAVTVSRANAGRGAPQFASELRGSDAVARTFKGQAGGAQSALVDGVPGLVYAPGGKVLSVMEFSIADGRIKEVNVIVDAAMIATLDLEF